MQDNQHQQHLCVSVSEDQSSDPTEEVNGSKDSPVAEFPRSNISSASIPTGGARPKIYSSFMRLTKSKSARFSQRNGELGEKSSHANISGDLNCPSLTSSASFLTSHRPFIRDVNALNRIHETPCDDQEPLERWKNAGMALRKALSSSSSFAASSPLTSYVNRPFRFPTQTLPLNRSGRKSNRYRVTRKNILDTDSIAISETSKLLNNIPISSPSLSSSKMSIPSASESPSCADLNINSSQVELQENSAAVSLPKLTSYTKQQRADYCSKSENEIDTTESRVLERSPGMFNLCVDDHNLSQTFDYKTSNWGLSGSQTDLSSSQYQKGLTTCSHQSALTPPTTTASKISKPPTCAFGDSPDSVRSQTYKMLECRLSRLISSDDKSFFEFSSSDSDITDCSSVFEDDCFVKPIKEFGGTAQHDEREPKKQKRKSQTLKKYRNGETACSSDSIQEGTKNCLRQKKKMKGGLEETFERLPLRSGGYFSTVNSYSTRFDLSHLSETDSDSETKNVSSHRRSRVRSGIVSKNQIIATEDGSKNFDEFKLPSLPSKKSENRGARYTKHVSSMSSKNQLVNCTSTDSMSDNMQNGHRPLVTYSSSSSLDMLTGCESEWTLPLPWNIIDSLHTEPESHNKAHKSRGTVGDIGNCSHEKPTEKGQLRTWSLLDDLYSHSNENVSSLLNTSYSRNDLQCSEEGEYPGLNQNNACCVCSKCKAANLCCYESHRGCQERELE